MRRRALQAFSTKLSRARQQHQIDLIPSRSCKQRLKLIKAWKVTWQKKVEVFCEGTSEGMAEGWGNSSKLVAFQFQIFIVSPLCVHEITMQCFSRSRATICRPERIHFCGSRRWYRSWFPGWLDRRWRFPRARSAGNEPCTSWQRMICRSGSTWHWSSWSPCKTRRNPWWTACSSSS